MSHFFLPIFDILQSFPEFAILPLAIIPFAFGYSVLRYRLMDVELVVRRVFVYALTTLAISLLIGTPP